MIKGHRCGLMYKQHENLLPQHVWVNELRLIQLTINHVSQINYYFIHDWVLLKLFNQNNFGIMNDTFMFYTTQNIE